MVWYSDAAVYCWCVANYYYWFAYTITVLKTQEVTSRSLEFNNVLLG